MKRSSSFESQLTGAMVGPDEAEKQTQPMVKTCEVDLNGMRMTMAQIQMPHVQLHSMTLVYEWHIRDIKIKDEKLSGPRESEVFPLKGYHYGARAIIETEGWINLQLIDYNETKSLIGIQSMPKVTWVFVNQSENTQAKEELSNREHSTDGIRTGFIGFHTSFEYGKYRHVYKWPSWTISNFTRPPYLVSNGMKLRFYIEPPSIARSFFSNDGILLWRMDNYKERKQMERDELIWWHDSPYFYTSPQGYRVIIRLRLSETVCGWLWFVKGEFDSSLTLPFKHRLTMTIFNQSDQSKNLVISQVGEEAHLTHFNFETASASLLGSGGYVADDSLLIKAVVEPL